MVDCSHGNSGRVPERQPAVAADVAAQVAAGQQAICGVMLESNLLDGAQGYRTRPLVYGRSVTDPCLAWEKTLPVFGLLAAAVRMRRSRTRHPPQPSSDSSDFAPHALIVTD
jgi:3-deoxy-7-phosphoheptulonate synthase